MREEGLIQGAFLIFEAKHSTGDYHQQFDSQRFLNWFQFQLLSNLLPHCLIVLDRCPFHMVAQDAIVPQQMSKVSLRQWLSERAIPWQEKWLRARLIEEVEQQRDKKPIVERLAEDQGHKMLFLPVYHPELNPIEIMWATVKNYFSTTNESLPDKS